MTEDEIKADIKREVRKQVQDAILDRSLTKGINILGQLIGNACPEYFNTRLSLQSQRGSTGRTHIFDLPDGLISLVRVRDLGGNAIVISSTADNGAGLIRVTCSAAHGLGDGDKVFVHSANTETNGNWEIDYDATTHGTTKFDLLGSTWSADPGAGYLFKEQEFTIIHRTPLSEARAIYDYRYFLRGSTIVVDDPSFENDILIDYYAYPDAIDEIPARFHFGLVALGAVDLIELPSKDAPEFDDLMVSVQKNQNLWVTAQEMAKAFKPSAESRNLGQVKRIQQYRI